MRRGREEFDADALAFVVRFAEKDDAGFLLLLREGIGENEDGVHGERLVQVHQAAVRIDHDRLAFRAKFAALEILPLGLHGDTREDAGTAPLARGLRLWHRQDHGAVRGTVSQSRGRSACPKKQFAKDCRKPPCFGSMQD